jgi:ABC-type transport system substrate-binding protein
MGTMDSEIRTASESEPLRALLSIEPSSLEPNSRMADSSAASIVLDLVCGSLLALDEAMTLQPALALDWNASADHRTFRLVLDGAAELHDGTPLTADLVAWNISRALESRSGSPLRADYAGLRELRAVGARDLVISFEAPFVAFPHWLTWRTHITSDTLDQPVGAGPYRLVDWERGSHLQLAAHGSHGGPRAVEVSWTTSAKVKHDALVAGTADVIESVPAVAADAWVRDGLVTVATAPGLRRTTMVMRVDAPPFDDPRVRRAFAYAIDRDRHARELYGAHAEPATGLFGELSPWQVELNKHEHDPDRACALLAEAGRRELAIRAVAPPFAAALAERCLADLASVGVQAELVVFPDPPWWPSIYLDTDWQLAFQGAGVRPHPDVLLRREYLTGGAFNASRISDAQLDEAILAAWRAPSEAAVYDLVAEAQRRIHDLAVEVPLVAMRPLPGVRPPWSGLHGNPLGTLDLAGLTRKELLPYA